MLKRRGVPHVLLNAAPEKLRLLPRRKGATPQPIWRTGTNILSGKCKIPGQEHGRDRDRGHAEGAEMRWTRRRPLSRKKEKVIQLGGLHVLGTERHEARRIDNQLRGRSGRQGDPGSSRFYLSLEDDLLRIFGSERISNIMNRLGIEEDQPIEHRLVSKAIENAQHRVEGHNFEIRKHLLEYDNVMNKQREVVYTQRRDVLAGDNLKDSVVEMIEEQAEDIVDLYADEVFIRRIGN
jgi:preprotein translocase subunit SecA